MFVLFVGMSPYIFLVGFITISGHNNTEKKWCLVTILIVAIPCYMVIMTTKNIVKNNCA